MRTYLQALKFFRDDRRHILGALALLLASTGLALLKPWPLAWIVDRLSGADAGVAAMWTGSTPAFIAVLSGALVLIHGAHALVGAWQQGVVIVTGLRGLARVRQAVFAWLLRLSLRRLQGSRAGDLIYRATWDSYAFQTLLTQGVFTAAGATLSVVAMTLVMAQLDGRLTLVALATIPVLMAVMRGFGPQLGERAGAAQSADAQVAGAVEQGVALLPLIQGFTREAFETSRFAERVEGAFQNRWRQHRLEVAYLALVALVLATGTGAIVWAGSGRVEAGRLTVGELLVFVAYLFQLYEPLSQLSHVGSTVSQARAGTVRVLELLESNPGAPRAADGAFGPAALPDTAPAIEFEHVSFAHVPGQPVLHDLVCRIEPGEVIVLTGPSGSGKSTLLHLLPRFFDPDSGRIRLNGQDLIAYPVEGLRRRITMVLQESRLLPGTLAENIALGRDGASREAVEAAARAADADGFIRRLPLGYDTVVGEGAARLSVGEQQRIGLARAFLKDAPVLLLDEPTSALDEASEAAVLDGLAMLVRGRTVLLVTHRPAAFRLGHRILHLHDGQLKSV
ncbi:MAG: ABC transporter ATP-binding protein [Verrucomicrobiae bacterium]|nr:ABC transporter ATP-binding protein [Verrucomicrobiae bacterium]